MFIPIFLFLSLTFATAFFVDLVLLKMRYKQCQGIFRMMMMGDENNVRRRILLDLLLPAPNKNVINTICTTGCGCLTALEHNCSLKVKLRCLDVFTDLIIYNLKDVSLKKEITDSTKLTLVDIMTSYFWLHKYVYSASVKEKFTEMAFTYLNLFLSILTNHMKENESAKKYEQHEITVANDLDDID